MMLQKEISELTQAIFIVNFKSDEIMSLTRSARAWLDDHACHSSTFTVMALEMDMHFTNPDYITSMQAQYQDLYQELLPVLDASREFPVDSNHYQWTFLPIELMADTFALIGDRSCHLQKEIDRLRFVIDRVPNYLFWKNQDSIFLGCNKFFAETAGLSSSLDIVGKSDFELPWSHEESESYIADDRDVMKSRESKLNIEETQTVNGKEVTLLTSKVPLFDAHGEIEGVLGIYTDITKLKQTQKELSEQKKLAESANAAKSNFLATISHELRTPLNGILGTLQILQNQPGAVTYKSQLQDMTSAAKTLSALVNDILDFTSMEQGKVTIKKAPFVLADVIQVMGEMRFNAQERGLELRFSSSIDPAQLFIGDALRIRQVLSNLVSNAVKFTVIGHVDLSIALVMEPQPMLCFAVEDTGIGMSEEQQAIVFNRFVQVESDYNRRFDGVGLGLAICKELVERMGGQISVTSELGAGARFQFDIPVELGERAHDGVLAMGAMHDVGFRQARILMVEDNPLNQRVLQMMLSDFPFQVDIAENGFQALKFLSGQPYDLVFLDISLPDIDGIAIAQKIRESFSKQQLPVIAVTAHAFDSDRQRCLDAGVNDIIIKPIDMNGLHHLLTQYLPDSF